MPEVGPAPSEQSVTRWQKLQEYRQRHPYSEIALFFVGGFVFDLVTLSRIDDTLTILQQAVYLAILGLMLAWDIRTDLQLFKPEGKFEKVWRFREDLIHFLL